MHLKDYIKLYSNTYTSSECKDIINVMSLNKWDRHTWYSPGGNTEMRDYDPYVMDIADFPLKPVMNKIGEYTNELSLYPPIVSQMSKPRANQYRLGQRMDAHNDHIHSLFQNDQGIPVLSIIIMLDEDYDGGELVYEFKDGDISYKLKAGDVIIWPSLFMYPHRVNEVTRGIRTSVVSWAY